MSTFWKEASSLIIVVRNAISNRFGQNLSKKKIIRSGTMSDGSNRPAISSKNKSPNADYKVLMVKRTGLSSFMASAYVYPGGKVEVSDYSPKWWSIFSDCGISQDDLNTYSSKIYGPRPPMITDPVTLSSANLSMKSNNFLSPNIALRIAAIRETFEETGILLLTHQQSEETFTLSDVDNPSLDLASWREKVRKDSCAFLELCVQAKLCPDVWSLSEWSNWLTPSSVGHRRFDTLFYIVCLEKQPKVTLDNSEVTTLKWITPSEILDEHIHERVFLAPPQVYEMSRLKSLKQFDQIKEFVVNREVSGTERWLPYIATYDDGAISALPGDDDYPKNLDPLERKPVPDNTGILEELRTKAKNINRLEIKGSVCTCYCNVKLACDHISPYASDSLTIQASL